MNVIFVLIAALAPVVLLFYYIYNKDKEQPEPTSMLLKGIGFGILSALLAMMLALPFATLSGGMSTESITSVAKALKTAFFGAAIPEETAKLVMLWLLLRNNPYFDEHFDGIVYAVCIGLGFAGFENVLYLFSSEDWIGMGIGRALFAVPGHFLFAVLMGYYYSLNHFNLEGKCGWYMVLLVPILAHGIYDGILFMMNLNEILSAVLMIVFLIFFNKLRKMGKAKIHALMGK